MLLVTLVYVAAPSYARDNVTDANTLIQFRSSLSNESVLALHNWNVSISLCNGNHSMWTGVICRNGSLNGLRLENISLSGMIDIDSLVMIPTLRSLSFMNNSFDGPMPTVKKLGWLKVLYLSLNRFSGDIMDDAFEGMNGLTKVYLARNEFTGKIPKSLVALPNLVDLSLEGNQFDGTIPDFPQRKWRVFNLANNHFEGRIPGSLSDMNSSSFMGKLIFWSHHVFPFYFSLFIYTCTFLIMDYQNNKVVQLSRLLLLCPHFKANRFLELKLHLQIIISLFKHKLVPN